MDVFPTQYGLLRTGVVPFKSIQSYTHPEAVFNKLNPEVQRDNDDRKAMINQLCEAQQTIPPIAIFSCEPYQLVANEKDVPKNWQQLPLQEVLIQLDKKKKPADAETRLVAHLTLAAHLPERLDSPVLVNLHVVKDPHQFMEMFLHFNRDRKRLPPKLMTWINSQGYLLKMSRDKIPSRQEIVAYVAVQLAEKCTSLLGRVEKPVGVEDWGLEHINYSVLGGIVNRSMAISGFNPEIIPARVRCDIVETCWDAIADAVLPHIFSPVSFAKWHSKAFGTVMTILMSGALLVAKRITQDGAVVNKMELYNVLVKKYGAAFRAELQTPEAQNFYKGLTSDGPKTARAMKFIEQILKIG